MDTVGKRLKELRKGAGIPQKAVAEMLNVTQSSINRYENDEAEPVYRNLVWYADYFDVSLDYILCRTDQPQGKLYKYEPATLKAKMADKAEWDKFVEACFEPNTAMNAKLKEALIKIAGGDDV